MKAEGSGIELSSDKTSNCGARIVYRGSRLEHDPSAGHRSAPRTRNNRLLHRRLHVLSRVQRWLDPSCVQPQWFYPKSFRNR
jgi:hypothetical protein